MQNIMAIVKFSLGENLEIEFSWIYMFYVLSTDGVKSKWGIAMLLKIDCVWCEENELLGSNLTRIKWVIRIDIW